MAVSECRTTKYTKGWGRLWLVSLSCISCLSWFTRAFLLAE